MVSARLGTCAVLLRTIFCISCKEGFPGILLTKSLAPFLITPNAPTITGIVQVLLLLLLLLLKTLKK